MWQHSESKEGYHIVGTHRKTSQNTNIRKKKRQNLKKENLKPELSKYIFFVLATKKANLPNQFDLNKNGKKLLLLHMIRRPNSRDGDESEMERETEKEEGKKERETHLESWPQDISPDSQQALEHIQLISNLEEIWTLCFGPVERLKHSSALAWTGGQTFSLFFFSLKIILPFFCFVSCAYIHSKESVA